MTLGRHNKKLRVKDNEIMKQDNKDYIPKMIEIGVCFWLNGRCHNQIIKCYADSVYIDNDKVWDIEKGSIREREE